MATDLAGWRFRNDNGSETTATWIQNQGVAATITTGVNFRIRFLHQQSAALVNNLNCQLQYSTDGTNWSDVNASSIVVRSSASANITDGGNTTSQLTGGSGTFIGATCLDEGDGNCGGTSLDVTSTGNFETEYSVQLRDADVFKGDVVYLRDWNSDTGAPWTTYSAGVASLTANASRVKAVPAADPWANLADTVPTIDRQELAGVTPIEVPISADPWENLADTNGVAFIKQDVLKTAAPSPDDFNNFADSVAFDEPHYFGEFVAYDRQDVAGVTPKPVNVPADPWGNLADATPIVDERGYLRIALSADPNAAYDERLGLGLTLADAAMPLTDQTPIIDRQGFLAVSITDPWANLADTTPTIDERGILTVTVSPDANAAYAERVGLGLSLTGDMMTFADQTPDVDLKGAAITKNVPEDAWGTLADTTPIYSEFGFLTVSAADPWANLADQSLNLYADHFVTFGDPWESLADTAPTVDRQSIGTTPKTANVPADPWENLADQAPTVDERGILKVTPTIDSLAAYDERLGLAYLRLADDLNQWADSRDASTTGVVPKSYNVPADDLANYAERVGLGLALRGDLMAMADQPADFTEIGFKTAAPAADPMTMADAQPTVVKTTNKTAAPTADPNVAYADRIGTGRGFTDDLANYGERVGLGISLRENLAAYDDSIQANTGGNYRLTITDAIPAWQDAIPDENYGKFYNAIPADSMSMGDQAATYTLGKLYSVTPDALPPYAEIFGLGAGLADSGAAYFDSVAESRFGYLLALLADQNEEYSDSIGILYLGFDQLAAIITESMANWDDAAAFIRAIMAIKVSGRLIESASVNGEILDDSVALNGKVGDDTVSIEGEFYQGV